MADLLITTGLVIFLLGLLTGMAVPAMKNPRMGVSSHLVGMTNGPFLVGVGLLWPRLDLAHWVEVVAVVILVYSGFANWLAPQLGALWGAGGRYAPAAAGDHKGEPWQERIVEFLLVSPAPLLVAATAALIVGLLR